MNYHANVTKEMEVIKISQKDTVPWNIRGNKMEGYIYSVNLLTSLYINDDLEYDLP